MVFCPVAAQSTGRVFGADQRDMIPKELYGWQVSPQTVRSSLTSLHQEAEGFEDKPSGNMVKLAFLDAVFSWARKLALRKSL